MTNPEPVQIRGHNGTVTFDGTLVTIARTGFLARSTIGKGSKSIPVRQIASVQLKPAGPLMNGFIQFATPGGIERRSRFGRQAPDAVRDENSVLFTLRQQPQFEWLRATVERAIANPPATGAPAADPVAQLDQLARLHAAGALTDREFADAKTNLLWQLRP